jgi:hypothetical protein
MGKSGAIANVVWLIAPLALSVPIGYIVFLLRYNPAVLPPVIALACSLGFALLMFAKISSIRSGKFLTWGTRELKPMHRHCYRIGYLLMGLGMTLMFAMLLYH